jgi:hypothetical protein
MTNAVVILNKTASKDVDSFNRSVVSGSDIDNGWVFYMAGVNNSGSSEVWDVRQPTTGSLTGLWMAASPENVLTASKYRGIDPDPRNFTNSASYVFDAIKLQVGDIITLTADAMITGAGIGSAYAIATLDQYKFTWSAAAYAANLTVLRWMQTTYISIGSGGIDTQRVAAYRFEVINNS